MEIRRLINEIGRCKGYNGGAIKNIKGTLKVYGDAKIHDCVSVTEGGAIHNSQRKHQV